MTDSLNHFEGLESCSECGCLTLLGAIRCPECGTFHSDLTSLPDRDPPPIVEETPNPKDLDPSLYSLNPVAALPPSEDEDEELPDPTIDWHQSSTDFTFDDSEDLETLKLRADEDGGEGDD